MVGPRIVTPVMAVRIRPSQPDARVVQRQRHQALNLETAGSTPPASTM